MNINNIIDKQKLMIAGILIMIGVLSRITLHDYFNSINNPFTTNGFLDVFFIIALISILSGILLGKYFIFIIPICVIGITDIFYGIIDPINAALWATWLFLFTTSGYVFIAILGLYTRKNSKFDISFFPKILGAGIFGIIVYDLWTNFGFWLSYSKLGFYPQTLGGLTTVFIGGLPFMLWHILSFSIAFTLIILPIIYYKDLSMFAYKNILKPNEKIYILSATLILITASIITAII
jgi:hypothetical protein